MDEEGSGSGVESEAGGGDIGVWLAVLGVRRGKLRVKAGEWLSVQEAFWWSTKRTAWGDSGGCLSGKLETEPCPVLYSYSHFITQGSAVFF